MTEQILKTIPESAVVDEVKKIIKATGLKVQRINTGCFQIGAGQNRRYIKTAERRAIKPSTKRAHRGHKPKRWRGVRSA